MKIFLDSVEVNKIKEFNELGIVDGITTNPSLIAKSGKDYEEILVEITSIVKGPISAEIIAIESSEMIKEAKALSKIAKNIVIKIPITPEGIKTCYELSKNNIQTNVTLCFSANQAILAAKAGATYISPFVGRIDDIGENGMDLIAQIRKIYDNYKFSTQILAASIRSAFHVTQSALIGADVVTVPVKILQNMFENSLTKKGLDIFLKDWNSTGQQIKQT